jgi:hypothetical protein
MDKAVSQMKRNESFGSVVDRDMPTSGNGQYALRKEKDTETINAEGCREGVCPVTWKPTRHAA